MAPRGVIYINTGKKVAVGFNSNVYGLWPTNADDSSPNPIVTFPKTDEGWQMVNSEFQRIERFGLGSDPSNPAVVGNLGSYNQQLSTPPNANQYPQNLSQNLSQNTPYNSPQNSQLYPPQNVSQNPVSGSGVPNVPYSNSPQFQNQQQPPGVSQPGYGTPGVNAPNFGNSQQQPYTPYQNPSGPSPYGTSYNQPGYNQPGYNQPGYNQPGAPNGIPSYPGNMPYGQSPYGSPQRGPLPYGQNPYLQNPSMGGPYQAPGPYGPYASGMGSNYYAQAHRVSNHSYAVISLVFGILGLFLFELLAFPCVVALLYGILFNREERKARSAGVIIKGKGLAIAGIIMGSIGMLFFLIFLVSNPK